jgi:SAM-dependent methyltransferase
MGKMEAYQDEGIYVVLPIKESKKYSTSIKDATEQFNRRLEEIEKRCINPDEDPEKLFNATQKAIDEMGIACEEFETAVDNDKNAIKDAQAEFRARTNHIVSKSYLFNRARTWPQGYQGDYLMLENIYRNSPLSTGIGYYLDKYVLASTLSVAVRARRETLRDILKKEIEIRESPKILDIACGSSRELLEISPNIIKARAKTICIDFDSDALAFSADRLSYADRLIEHLEFRRYNALRMVNHDRNLREFGVQDIIYSTGLFDYLEDDILIRLLSSLYKLLAPKGNLIASFKDCQCYKSYYNEWFLAWDGFKRRTLTDMYNLFKEAGIPYSALTTVRESSGVIIFFNATK